MDQLVGNGVCEVYFALAHTPSRLRPFDFIFTTAFCGVEQAYSSASVYRRVKKFRVFVLERKYAWAGGLAEAQLLYLFFWARHV
jgi:hypothetical protein